MNIQEISSTYFVRKMTEDDIEQIYELSLGNPLYYQFCPPSVTRESVREDLLAFPPQISYEQKHYIGFFKEDRLIAVMDLLFGYPNEKTAFIGLFMMAESEQGKGVGTGIIEECAAFLKRQGYDRIRLGFIKGNPQSEAFWRKNRFKPTGEESGRVKYTVVLMERNIQN